MQTQNALEVVFRNQEPRREPRYPNVWLLVAAGRSVKVFVVQDGMHRPRVIRKEAA
jgi:hypothetical protein